MESDTSNWMSRAASNKLFKNGLARAFFDVYSQCTRAPKTDTRLPKAYLGKMCVHPTDEQMRILFPSNSDVLYSNPFWSDPRVLTEDTTAVTTWHYANAVSPPSRGTNAFYFCFIVFLHAVATLYLWLAVSWLIGVIALVFFVIYDCFWSWFLRVRRRYNKYLSQMSRRGFRFLNKQSWNAYQMWLEELKESNFSQFIQIQNWHQQELLLDETRRQTRALNQAAASAALTAYNTTVIRNNQPNPRKLW
jgi:hypothetical protein